MFDIKKIRKDFPILNQQVNKKLLVYFDNAATTQKPQTVIDALSTYYTTTNANIHRGIHSLAEKATQEYETTRDTVQKLINAQHRDEIIFTQGTTASINLVASSFGKSFINKGDEIIISTLEHHSNIVPWQLLCEEKEAILKVIPINEKGEIIFSEYQKLLSNKTKLVAITYVSNALGTINPVKEIIEKAHQVSAKVLLDGAQASSHLNIDVQDLDCDFYAMSAHKLYGPTGVGVLYGKKELLEVMPPYQGGGEMIKEVTFQKSTYADLPYKFEAGTPNIAGVIAFKSALDYIQTIGKDAIIKHEEELTIYATKKLLQFEGIKIIGTAEKKISVISFMFDDIHHQDLAIMLDQQGIAIRTGHHCTQPLMQFFGILGTSRISFGLYNTKDEIDCFIQALNKVINMLR